MDLVTPSGTTLILVASVGWFSRFFYSLGPMIQLLPWWSSNKVLRLYYLSELIDFWVESLHWVSVMVSEPIVVPSILLSSVPVTPFV